MNKNAKNKITKWNKWLFILIATASSSSNQRTLKKNVYYFVVVRQKDSMLRPQALMTNNIIIHQKNSKKKLNRVEYECVPMWSLMCVRRRNAISHFEYMYRLSLNRTVNIKKHKKWTKDRNGRREWERQRERVKKNATLYCM